MLATYLYVRCLFEARGALFSAIMLGTAFQYLQAGTGSRVDMTLTFFMTIAFFEFLAIAEGLSNRTSLLYFAIALGVLAKGPIGAALPALVAIVWITLAWRWSVFRRLRLARGMVIVGLVGGGWYIAAIVSGGAAFVHKQILGENLYRLIGHAGVNHGHAHPFYYEDGALLAGFLPWTPIALIAALQALRHPRRLDSRLGYLLVWFLVILVFYNFPQSKRGVYLLSLFPAMTTIIALYLSDAISHRNEIARPLRWLARAMGVFFIAAGAGAITGCALLYFSPPSIQWVLAQCGILLDQLPAAVHASVKQRGVVSVVLPLAATAIGIYLLRARPRAENVFFAITGGFVAIVLAVNLVVEPAVANTLTLKGFAAATIKTSNGQPIGYWGSLDYDFAFYSGRNIQFVTKPGSQFDYVVSSEDDYKLMWPAMRARYKSLLRSGPTDFNGTGQMILFRRVTSSAAPTSPPSVTTPKPAIPALPTAPSTSTKSSTRHEPAVLVGSLKPYEVSEKSSVLPTNFFPLSLGQARLPDVRDGCHKSRHHFAGGSPQADIANPRDLRFVEIRLDQHASALLHFNCEAGRRIDRRRCTRDDYQIGAGRMLDAMLQNVRRNRFAESDRVALEQSLALRALRRQHLEPNILAPESRTALYTADQFPVAVNLGER
jgi:hypothetical protein